jgi:Skp family chaperone for outer membrane proteins
MSMAKFKIMAIGLSIALGTVAFGQGVATPAAATPAATAPAGPVPTKIGVVNIQQAIGECAEGKKEIDALQQKFNPKQDER